MKPKISPLLLTIIAVILGFSIFLRFYHLGEPKDQIFDEVYFPVFAQDYIAHTDFFDAHPPLGKLIIAESIDTFGNTTWGWRIFNAGAGILLLLIILGFTFDLTENWHISILALFLAAIDPMALVESRVGLINIYLALFSLASLWFFWRWWKKEPHRLIDFILALIFFGAAASVKWIGLGALGAAVLFLIVKRWPKSFRLQLHWYHAVLLILIPLVYLAVFTPDLLMRNYVFWQKSGIDYLVWWHKSAFDYHAHLTATHPYGSPWWSWPFVIRPLWMYFKSPTPGTIVGIIEIGNVVTWIGGFIALIALLLQWPTLRKKIDQPDSLIFLFVTYVSLYLPWILITRVKFIYHYFIPMLLLLILLAYTLYTLILTKKEYRWIGIVFLVAATAFFIFFLPLVMGIPIPEGFYRAHLWFRSWI